MLSWRRKRTKFLGSEHNNWITKGDEHPEKFINDIIATSGHLLVDDMGNEISGCDVYVSDQTGKRNKKILRNAL